MFIKVHVEQWKLWDQVVNQTSHYNTVILMYQPLYWYIKYTNKFVDTYINHVVAPLVATVEECIATVMKH